LIETGRINVTPWITHRASMADVPNVFPSWIDPRTGVVKAMIAL
jgi:threonine dehydrogenase-like Zn-dependent dehydrogenase